MHSNLISFPLCCFSVEHSWERTKELLVEVARQGEVSGHGVPCLVIAAKDDLDPCQITVQDSAMVSQEMGIGPPIRVSMKVGDSKNLFGRIVRAAEYKDSRQPFQNTARIHKPSFCLKIVQRTHI
ncbi:hypothetical protein Patl1_32769 [Pistacia atlantica]|uniref:Uncharacterized protein n=1 Tax=Pistacia atlantica TaxID=434234 RepID=A0ACC1AQY1_9ROSI|nr:hypothetical protein Patl1_32769 [Pistacia atlantica]